MQFDWINKKEENNELILLFNGWGMNKTAIEHLDCLNYDVLEINDYTNLKFNFSQFDFNKYLKKYLVCWSMGVYVANLFAEYLNDFDKRVAINGTSRMIDDNFGIPERIYQITIRLFSEDSCDKFIKNMFCDGAINSNIKITRTLEELKNELISIQTLKLKEELRFDLAIVSDNDRIVPTKNQINFWSNKTEIKKISASHYPFDNYKKWSDLLC